jgi:PLP dependent protein
MFFMSVVDIAFNLSTVKARIHQLEKQYARPAHSVSLLAVSKNQPIAAIESALAAGQYAFGENYLQEALAKIIYFKDPALEWHYIGSIQRNKTQKIAQYFQWVHSVDSSLIAQRLNDQRPAHLPPLNICLQVNTSHEARKSGIAADSLPSLARFCTTLPRLQLRGLMCLPAAKTTLAEQRVEFHQLHELFKNITESGIVLDTLSIGMSSDLEAAIAEGATLVRLGTAIFGPRN